VFAYERAFANRARRLGNPRQQETEAKYGPDGAMLVAATLVDALVGCTAGVVAVGLYISGVGFGRLWVLAWSVVLVMAAFMSLVVVRALQAERARRRFNSSTLT